MTKLKSKVPIWCLLIGLEYKYKKMPKISVIMSVYNSEKYLSEAIESILNQTYTDFEFIITDDGSVDNSFKIMKEYQKKDNRIVVIKNDINLGISKSVNKMIGISKGGYIARMDGDDISLPKRFEKQVAFMDNNPEYVVCGTFGKYFGRKKGKMSLKSKNTDIKALMYYGSPIINPSAFIRRSVMVDNNIYYNEKYEQAQDYKLWVDLASYGKFYNISHSLLLYRVSKNQVSTKYRKKQNKNAIKIRKELINKYILKQGVEDYVVPDVIRIDSLKELKKIVVSNELDFYTILLSYYLSVDDSRAKYIMYFIFSFDWVRMTLGYTLRILRKFMQPKRASIL